MEIICNTIGSISYGNYIYEIKASNELGTCMGVTKKDLLVQGIEGTSRGNPRSWGEYDENDTHIAYLGEAEIIRRNEKTHSLDSRNYMGIKE